MSETMSLEDYLKINLSVSSQKIYLFEINRFINHYGKSKAEQSNHEEVLKYLDHLRRQYTNSGTVHRILQSLKQYFYYLIEIGKRGDHPCRFIRLKDRPKHQVQLQDLLSEEELEKLLIRKERYEILRIRNQVVMSLLIYQGLRLKELVNLKVQDIDLEKGALKIQSTIRTNGRELSLKSKQILLFYKYLKEVRSELLKVETNQLIITKKGSAENGEGILYLVSTYRKQYRHKKITPTSIRQSVIANLLAKGTDLRIVQVFAGHKQVSTTEKYRQTNYEALRKSVENYHPLN